MWLSRKQYLSSEIIVQAELLTQDGGLPHVRLGAANGRVVYPVADVQRWLSERAQIRSDRGASCSAADGNGKIPPENDSEFAS